MAADDAAAMTAADDGAAMAAPVEGDESAAQEMLVEILASKGALSAELSNFIRSAVQSWANGGGKLDLDACFGWKPRRGERFIGRRIAEARRQAALARAYRAITATPGCEGISAWRRCDMLISELEEFGRRQWQTWRDSGPPAGTSDLRLALHDVFAASLPNDPPPAMTTTALYQALKRAREL